ncbi:NAD(P)-dependent dehydrogenase, short-chain alcohol dehydrogenase family [Gracilibacillus orientalis]|uniref:NAD(P)-dependent dehydrogenase, short-chain alcohol dehydrogenase family n=1 Tax=Gracilibacillus orientalis TaxID=334253 RepID=A0A1I4NFK9_9BACI|nr:3-oxoacyl-ACP reductase family protein [Gracilibacillus orientalis]SFM14324.1 NAD(P)-dependent dehydrogenase, short-chain alcohol dehydrogenase family [Gracilibacillus orientalis]
MKLKLENKVALVTGGSRGIGAGIAKKLAREGANVVITYTNSKEKAQAVIKDINKFGQRGLAIQANSANTDEVINAVDQTASNFGKLDILVNNAGIFPFGDPEDFTLEEIDRTLAIHVRAVYIASQTAIKHMEAGGRIISIGSCFANRVPFPGVSLYAMSKSALIGFTKGLARDVGQRGITVNVVDPGSTDTDMNPTDGPDAEEEKEWLAVGHYGNVDDIAGVVTFIAGEDGRFITGTSVAVDGGFEA